MLECGGGACLTDEPLLKLGAALSDRDEFECFEAAEVRMLERMGADAVGMSTVPEVVVGRAMGMRCAAVSCITNPAAGTSPHPINHQEVIEVTRVAAHDFERLVEALVASL